jgi:hypothetical protein
VLTVDKENNEYLQIINKSFGELIRKQAILVKEATILMDVNGT